MPSAQATRQHVGRSVSWGDILPHWRLVAADLAALGLDLTDPGVWSRPWPPIRSLILTLPSDPTSRLNHALGGGA